MSTSTNAAQCSGTVIHSGTSVAAPSGRRQIKWSPAGHRFRPVAVSDRPHSGCPRLWITTECGNVAVCRCSAVAEQFLDRADVVALLEQMGGEGVTESVAGRRLREAGGADRFLDGPLENGFVEMMTAPLASEAVHIEARGREDPLPAPVAAGVGILARQRIG